MIRNRRLAFSSVLLVFIAFAGAISLVFLLYNLQKELAEQRRIFREDSVWVASQVDREARVFRYFLYRYGEKDAVSLFQLRRRFDVLWSRVESMDKGPLGELYLKLDGAESALSNGRKMLRIVDPLLVDLKHDDKETRDRVLALLNPAIDSFFRVARNASGQTLLSQEKRRLSFENTSKTTLVLVAAIFLSGAVLCALLLRNQHHLRELTHNLEKKVKERTLELEESNQSLQMMSQAIEQSPVSVMICSPEGSIEYVNPNFVEVSGYEFEEAVGRNPRFIQSGNTPESVYREMWQAVHADRVWKGEICNRKKNGQLFWESISFSPIKNGQGQIIGYLAVKEDISQRKSYEEQLLKQANYDSLTGLPNRTLAMDRLKQAILQAQRRGSSVALLFIDLDNFKQINDTMGHDCGDYLLKEAAERFSGCLRDCDTAARFGGDEFLIILSELENRKDVAPILDRIVTAFSYAFHIGNSEHLVTASIGVSMYPQDSSDASKLLKFSDNAMYKAKEKGKNSYSFFSV